MKQYSTNALLLLCLSLPTLASATDIIKKSSQYGVKETMDKFETLIKSKGMDVFARINHQKNAEDIGMKMNNSEVLIFGNPIRWNRTYETRCFSFT